MIDIAITPKEGGAALVTVGPFTDQSTPAIEVTPTSLVWTLSTRSGTVINSRSYVVLTPAPTVEFLLSGNDLAVSDSRNLKRLITIDATYTSVISGVTTTGIPLREQAEFTIEHFVITRPA